MECADGGNFEEYIATTAFKCLDWIEKIQLTKGIAQGLDCLHNKNILHRDLVRDLVRKLNVIENFCNFYLF